MKKLDYHWKTNATWYYRDSNGDCFLRENAPAEAQESYKRYLTQMKEIAEDERNGLLD